MAAAVARSPGHHALAHKGEKPKLGAPAWEGRWQEVPTLLAELVTRRPGRARSLLGFAPSQGTVVAQAVAKFARKGCDLLVANRSIRPVPLRARQTNQGWLVWARASKWHRPWRLASKLAVAHGLPHGPRTALLEPVVPPVERPPQQRLHPRVVESRLQVPASNDFPS